MYSDEYTIYCLSKSKGWICIASKYDDRELVYSMDEPNDSLLKMEFRISVTDPSNIKEIETILFQTENVDQLENAKRVHGKLPNQPYI